MNTEQLRQNINKVKQAVGDQKVNQDKVTRALCSAIIVLCDELDRLDRKVNRQNTSNEQHNPLSSMFGH